MANYDPILTSVKLTTDTANKTRLLASAAQSRAEIWRLTTLLAPASCYDETSTTTWDADVATVARIGLLKTTSTRKAVSNDGKDESAKKKEAIERTLAGETIETPTSIQQLRDSEETKLTATLDAIEFLTAEIAREKTALAIEYSKKMKPKHDAIMGRVCKTILEARTAYAELYDLKRHLIDNEIGLRGLCLTTPDFLGAPNDAYSDMATFLQAAKVDGFISAVPVGMRL
jgi:hypothetical protein